MKIVIADYELEITKVTDIYLDKEENILHFLNSLSIVFSEAAEYNKEHGYNGCYEADKEIANNLYKYCNEHGLYNK